MTMQEPKKMPPMKKAIVKVQLPKDEHDFALITCAPNEKPDRRIASMQVPVSMVDKRFAKGETALYFHAELTFSGLLELGERCVPKEAW